MKTVFFILLLFSPAFTQTPSNDKCAEDNENIACCFVNIPKQLSHIISIADSNEPGERLYVKGSVTKSDGKTPYPNVILYAYHTNQKGIYPKNGTEVGVHKWHGYLHSWGKSNDRGEFEIRSIRPAQYPSRSIPAHIHMVAKEPNGKMDYVNDILFLDDPLVKDKKEDGVISLKKNKGGVWEGTRTILIK